MKKKLRTCIGALLLLAASSMILAGCSNDDDDDSPSESKPGSITGTIEAVAGKTLAKANGTLSVELPSGYIIGATRDADGTIGTLSSDESVVFHTVDAITETGGKTLTGYFTGTTPTSLESGAQISITFASDVVTDNAAGTEATKPLTLSGAASWKITEATDTDETGDEVKNPDDGDKANDDEKAEDEKNGEDESSDDEKPADEENSDENADEEKNADDENGDDETADEENDASGNLGITVTIASISDLSLTPKTTDAGVTFTASGAATGATYSWNVDGTAVEGSGATYTLNTAGRANGAYTVVVVAGNRSAAATVTVGANSDDTTDGNAHDAETPADEDTTADDTTTPATGDETTTPSTGNDTTAPTTGSDTTTPTSGVYVTGTLSGKVGEAPTGKLLVTLPEEWSVIKARKASSETAAYLVIGKNEYHLAPESALSKGDTSFTLIPRSDKFTAIPEGVATGDHIKVKFDRNIISNTGASLDKGSELVADAESAATWVITD